MRVRMKGAISGLREGADWPAPGEEFDLPDQEGAELCATGMAEPVMVKDEEKAVAPPAEKRGPGRPRKTAEAE